jgi:hypothetical protein
MLKHNEVNPLAVFGLRRLEHCPPHFTKFNFDASAPDKTFTDWIYENLEGRFYYGDEYYTNESNGRVGMHKCAAFELAGEASYFALQLDTINKVKDLW